MPGLDHTCGSFQTLVPGWDLKKDLPVDCGGVDGAADKLLVGSSGLDGSSRESEEDIGDLLSCQSTERGAIPSASL